MGDQYFAATPRSPRDIETVDAVIQGFTFVFMTDSGVFSKGRVDRGTELLADALVLAPDAHVLDVGCGYGVLGIVAATLAPNGRVVMTDVNERAVDLARRNVQANALPHIEVRVGAFYDPVGEERFDAIISNPPVRAGKDAVWTIVDGARDHMRPGGSLWMVARTRQGAKSLRDHIEDVLGGCDTVARGSGYRVLRSHPR